MAVNFIQTNFSAGEISPSLYARVDLAKYHVACKLLRNFFVWAHGGVSNRAGTMFVGRCPSHYDSDGNLYPVHLIPFQFNLEQAYILEFGHLYMRVIMNGGYVLEPEVAIKSINPGYPGSITVMGAPFSNGDQVYISGIGTSLDSTPGRQYLVTGLITTGSGALTQSEFNLTDLDGNLLGDLGGGGVTPFADADAAATAAGISFAGTIAAVYSLITPYSGDDVKDIKWTQSADTLTLCHPDYMPRDLERTNHYSWRLKTISFAPHISPPASVTFTHGGSGTWNYMYTVTAICDSPPEQSRHSNIASGTGAQLDQTSTPQIVNTISWTPVANASRYYVYKTTPSTASIPAGVIFGYIGQTTGTSFIDANIAPDYSQSPPHGTNPFLEGPITAVGVLSGGTGYTSDIDLVVHDVSGTGAVLTPTVVGGVITAVTVENGGKNYQNPTVTPANTGTNATGILHAVTAWGTSQIVSVVITNGGSGYYGETTCTPTSGGTGCTFTVLTSGGIVTGVTVDGLGYGYTNGDSLVFSNPAGGSATFSVVVTPSGNFPSCATYFQQRKVFAGSSQNPQTIWMTQPADYKNMDVSNVSQPSDAIEATIASNQVHAIKWLVPMNNLLIMTSGGAWALMGGSVNNPVAVTPSNIVIAPQSYTGCGELPPIVINYDVIYVQSKGSIVRDLAYNFYAQVYTGTDMSILSNHLFFGHNLERWCYAEEPYKQLWVVRDDGVMLSFTYLKEQDVYAWSHHDSFGNSGTDKFLSVATIPEQQIENLNMDSVYVVTERTIPDINTGNPVRYVERMDSRNFMTDGVADITKAWFVDCGLRYDDAAATTISGLDHLNGATVSILADGNVEPQQVVVDGAITLQYPASVVTVGLPYTAQFQTLCMEPEGMSITTQDYRKRISAVAVRVMDTRGLKVGPDFNTLTAIKERTPAAYLGQPIPLFTGDRRVVIDSKYLIEDDVCIQCDDPLPATILGVIPEITIGDGPG